MSVSCYNHCLLIARSSSSSATRASEKCPPCPQSNNNNCAVCMYGRAAAGNCHTSSTWNCISTAPANNTPSHTHTHHACNALSKLYYCDRVIRIVLRPTACASTDSGAADARTRALALRMKTNPFRSRGGYWKSVTTCHHSSRTTKLFNARRVLVMTTINACTQIGRRRGVDKQITAPTIICKLINL